MARPWPATRPTSRGTGSSRDTRHGSWPPPARPPPKPAPSVAAVAGPHARRRLSWASVPLGLHGVWRGLAPPVERTLLPSRGRHHRVVLPDAARPRHGRHGDGPGRGTGYAERLRLTLPPWAFPSACCAGVAMSRRTMRSSGLRGRRAVDARHVARRRAAACCARGRHRRDRTCGPAGAALARGRDLSRRAGAPRLPAWHRCWRHGWRAASLPCTNTSSSRVHRSWTPRSRARRGMDLHEVVTW